MELTIWSVKSLTKIVKSSLLSGNGMVVLCMACVDVNLSRSNDQRNRNRTRSAINWASSSLFGSKGLLFFRFCPRITKMGPPSMAGRCAKGGFESVLFTETLLIQSDRQTGCACPPHRDITASRFVRGQRSMELEGVRYPMVHLGRETSRA